MPTWSVRYEDPWLTNPFSCLVDAVSEGFTRFVFQRERLRQRRLHPHTHVRRHFLGTQTNPTFMIVDRLGASVHDLFTRAEKPLAVYPVWSFTEDSARLRKLLAQPYYEIFTGSRSSASAHTPVEGQDHKVVLIDFPNMQSNLGRQRVLDIANMIEDFQNVKVHASGLRAYSTAFHYNWDSFDYDPTFNTRGTRLILPNGVVLDSWDMSKRDQLVEYRDWIHLLGFSVSDFPDHRKTILYNMRSLRWAVNHYEHGMAVKFRYSPSIEETALKYDEFGHILADDKHFTSRRRRMKVGKMDKVLCDACTLKPACKIAREGAVCTVGGAFTVSLADMFGSRDVARVIDGLSAVVRKQADRVEKAVEGEDPDDPNPEVTRQLNSLFKNGVMLAKLLDPSLNGKGTTVNINNHNQVAAVGQANPQQMVAAAVRALEDQGIPRNEITPDMLRTLLAGMANVPAPQAIEATAVEFEEKQ